MSAQKKRFEVVGKGRRRVDGRAKALGQLQFADDMVLPRMLHCKLLRSPHPHAVIEDIRVEKAQKHPGVHLVLTGKDFPIPFGIMPVSQDEYPLAPERVRYVGDPVAAVIATDEQTAAEALELIEVKFKVLKTIADPQEALQNPEPRIHEYGEQGNIHRNQSYEFGDVDEALAASDHVFEDLFFFEGNTHLAMEQQASLAAVEGDGKLLLTSSTQNPALPAPAALARAADAGLAHPRDRRAKRRRLRRQVRSGQPRNGGVQGGADARPAGEDLPHARGSVLPAPRPASGADEIPHRRHQGRQAHRRCICRRCSTAAATARTARRAPSTPAC